MVKQILKKYFRLLLVALYTLMTSINLYAYDFEKDGKYYNINGDGTSVSIIKGSYEYTGDVIIPSTVTYCEKIYNVTSIADYAFMSCSELKSITIPNSVTSIGNYAFNGCLWLINIIIPNSVTSIGEDAFDGTLWYNNQHDGLVYAGSVAYKYKGVMPNNTSISIKEGTKEIACRAFLGCFGLKSINIPNSVSNIGEHAFSNCPELQNIIIANSITYIGDGAFGWLPETHKHYYY